MSANFCAVETFLTSRRSQFRGVTRFTRQQFDNIVQELRPLVMRNRHVRMNVPEPTGRFHPTKLSLNNRVLLAIKFLVFASPINDLSQQFGLSPAAVSEELRHVVYAIVEGLSYEIAWPSAAQRQRLRDLMGPEFANAFGVVDGTFTPAFAGQATSAGIATPSFAHTKS
jgi:hypothetical protein